MCVLGLSSKLRNLGLSLPPQRLPLKLPAALLMVGGLTHNLMIFPKGYNQLGTHVMYIQGKE
jgi:hypothetical protein